MVEDVDLSEIHTSLAYVAGTITNLLLDKNIPHNILISNQGKNIFIIPR